VDIALQIGERVVAENLQFALESLDSSKFRVFGGNYRAAASSPAGV
jgi:hypothetical protein